MSAPSIVENYALACSADHAFAVYTERIGEWWHPEYTADGDTFESVTIEPRVGGRVVERHTDGREVEWGRVEAWEPGEQLAYTFSLALPAGHLSVVNVRFGQLGAEESDVTFAQAGWTDSADAAKFTEWRQILDRFAELATDRS